MPVKTHRLKIVEPYYSQVRFNHKLFEFRKNDRDFKLNDTLILIPLGMGNSKNLVPLYRKVNYIIYGPDFGVPIGYCLLYWSADGRESIDIQKT